MKLYFKDWSFKHPGPTDFKRVLENHSGLELDWYFQYFINTTHVIDYGIKEVTVNRHSTDITLEKIGGMPMPQDLHVIFSDESSLEYHIPLVMMRGHRELNGIEKLAEDWPWTNPTYTITIPSMGKTISLIQLDPSFQQADVNRENNLIDYTQQ
mgnify:CR=1 FL=1